MARLASASRSRSTFVFAFRAQRRLMMSPILPAENVIRVKPATQEDRFKSTEFKSTENSTHSHEAITRERITEQGITRRTTLVRHRRLLATLQPFSVGDPRPALSFYVPRPRRRRYPR